MRQRNFNTRNAATVMLLLLLVIVVGSHAETLSKIDTRMAGQLERWNFVGSEHPWKQREDGVILSPIWKILGEAEAPGYFKGRSAYADDLTREDYAFLSSEVVEDLDLSVEFQIRYGSVTNMGLAFRAMDSRRMYCIQVEKMGRKGYSYHVSLWVQDAAGFRRQIAEGIVPHTEYPDHIRQTGPRNYEEWIASAAGWSKLRVQAIGSSIDVSINGQQAFECTDDTYTTGTVALIARWAIPFRNLELRGISGKLATPWKPLSGPSPKYFLPFDGRLAPYEVFPAVTHDDKGQIHVIANVAESPSSKFGIGIITSTDGAESWTDLRRFDDLGKFAPSGGAGLSPSLYSHQDGKLSCFVRHKTSKDRPEVIGVAESHDGGNSWSEVHEFIASGKPVSQLTTSGTIALYSPVQRLKDGRLLLSGYHYDTIPGGKEGSNADSRDRSLVFRSTDDGTTWTGPHYISRDNFDNNECMIAELSDGRLQAFMRTLRAPSMWTSYSSDGGLTWTTLVQSGVSAECPCILGHSSGTILLGNRGAGIFLNFSRDGGRSWEVIRVSPASGMMGMTELRDGRVLLVYHTGYRVPGRIRAQLLRVTETGIKPAR